MHQVSVMLMDGVQADFTLRRLQQLKERILGTESLVAIELDSRRNELVALNLVSLFTPPYMLSLSDAQQQAALFSWTWHPLLVLIRYASTIARVLPLLQAAFANTALKDSNPACPECD